MPSHVRTVVITPAVATTAEALPASFVGDPTDRLTGAAYLERGRELRTKDERMRPHHQSPTITAS